MKNVLENRLSPLIKYPGGKEKELNYILPALPSAINNYYEPFVGGGAVYFSIKAKKYYINDKSDELISLYEMVKEQNREFLDKLNAINYNWNIISKVVDYHEKTIADIYYKYKAGKKNMQQRAAEASRLFLTKGQNRPPGKNNAGLILLKGAKLYSYKHGFNSFSIKRVDFFFSMQ